MKEFVTLRPKMYSYLRNDGCLEKKAKDTRQRVVTTQIEFQEYKNCLKSNKIIPRLQQRFRSELNNVFAGNTNKLALTANVDKRIQTLDRFMSYLYSVGPRLLCKEGSMRPPKTIF